MSLFHLFGTPDIEDLKQKRNVKALIRALKRSDQKSRIEAAKALEQIGDPVAVEPLVARLKDNSDLVRQKAAEALGEMKIRYTYYEYPGGHTWPVWRNDLYSLAPLLFK